MRLSLFHYLWDIVKANRLYWEKLLSCVLTIMGNWKWQVIRFPSTVQNWKDYNIPSLLLCPLLRFCFSFIYFPEWKNTFLRLLPIPKEYVFSNREWKRLCGLCFILPSIKNGIWNAFSPFERQIVCLKRIFTASYKKTSY